MDGHTHEVGCSNQHIDLAAMHQPRDLGRKTGRDQRGIVRRPRQFKHEQDRHLAHYRSAANRRRARGLIRPLSDTQAP